MVGVLTEGISVQMELDTGAAVSLFPFKVYREKFGHIPLQKPSTRLMTYTGEKTQEERSLHESLDLQYIYFCSNVVQMHVYVNIAHVTFPL